MTEVRYKVIGPPLPPGHHVTHILFIVGLYDKNGVWDGADIYVTESSRGEKSLSR